MLFSPPNEFGKQTFYKVVGYSCVLHSLILLLLVGMEFWLGMRPTVISLRKPGRVGLTSRRAKSSSQGLAQSAAQASDSYSQKEQKVDQLAPQESPQPPVEKRKSAPEKSTVAAEKLEKKTATPAVKKISEKPLNKVVPERKIPEKKIDKKKEQSASDELKKPQAFKPELDAQKSLPKESSKKIVTPQKEQQVEATAASKKAAQEVPTVRDPHLKNGAVATQGSSVESNSSLPYNRLGNEEGDYEEVCAADAASSEDGIQKEFGAHFTIPEGFEEYDSFTISFDIKDGKVINVSPHTQGALVVYTAVKDALLKSTMPGRSRKNIIWVIT